MVEFELHPERLSTTDESGKRIFVFTADVRGRFRSWRSKVQFVLVIFFLALPWVQIDGRQALLLNVAERRFEIFGLSLRAHNAPLFFFVLAAAGFGLFFVTSLWGRVWCGWACPQTVFIDGVYRRIERWIEGPALERRKLARSPWTLKKATLLSLKWLAYLGVSLVITHSFLAYFVGTDQLATMVTRAPSENWASFLFICFSTGLILFDFAWFREQFCIIACPYGRFQSVLMDERSTIVAYDSARGEPRQSPQAKALAKAHSSRLGDCVNCYRCVQVCPTGIDIRRGLQLECIACTSCADACDEVMTKLKKPTGLIRYDTQLGLQGKRDQRLGSRSLIYLVITLISISALAFSISRLKPVDIAILRAKDAPYSLSKNDLGETIVVNHLKIELSNQSGVEHHVSFQTGVEIQNEGLELITAHRPFKLQDGKVTHADVFLRFPKKLLNRGSRIITFTVNDTDPASGETRSYAKEVTLVGPLS